MTVVRFAARAAGGETSPPASVRPCLERVYFFGFRVFLALPGFAIR